MASSSSFSSNSQYCPRWKYDVFLSFRGEDTRKTFTGHLYEGLKNKGIFTYQDDKRLEHGDSISDELLKAIEESQVALVVFSKNYATSRWCLNELVKIMECKKNENGQTVIPVFCDVDPAHVRYQRESFAEAFAKHESNYKDDIEGTQKVQGWRTALTAAANLKGYDIRQGVEPENIQQIVNQISSKLCKTSVSYLQDVVGIDTHLEEVKSLLEMENNSVRIVGIWGMGGIGKTTIARAIFDTLSYQFEAASFIADIKENKGEMHDLQNILLSELLGEKVNYVNNKDDGKRMIARRLRFKKALVVLDDIDHRDHLDYLVGHLNWYGDGSRIIATTRDKHLIDGVYEVTTLVDHQAIKLFNQYAFVKEEVPDECFEQLSLEVVSCAKGLPLALKVWGSFLHKRDITEWRSAIEQMKINSNSEIIEKLKISYDRLETIQRDIFLDIACFLRGREKDKIMPILQSCHAGADIGLSVLIDKSLVFISHNGMIQMHDLIQEMGKYVVKMQKDSGKPSRIWNVEDFNEVMANNTGAETMEAIWIDNVTKRLCFNNKAMKNMERLRILKIHNFHTQDGFIEYLPNNLHWFDWCMYRWKSLPETFEPKKVVHLDLRASSLHHLWTGTKDLPSLRRLNLGRSERLKKTPDFRGMPNLEYLNLQSCRSLEEVHHSLKCCRKLIWLDLKYCKSLKRFPYVNVESLEYLNIEDCSSLEEFPEILGKMKPELEIKMSFSGIRELPLSIIQHQAHLTELYLRVMKNLVALPSNIGMMKGLVKLYVDGCSKLESLPEEIGDLENLEELYAGRTLISRPSPSIVRLNKLKVLSFRKEKSRVFFVFPRVNEGLRSLEELDLSFCNLIDGGLPEDIGCLSSLRKLDLRGNNFEHLPQSIAQLSALEYLDLSFCKRLKELNLSGNNFEHLPQSIAQLSALKYLDLSFCKRLKELNLSGNNFEHLPQSMAQFGALRSLDLSHCKRLKELAGFMGMPNLETLNLSYCNLIDGRLVEDIGCLSSLKYLNLMGNNFKHLPRSMEQLGDLQFLDLSDCTRLTQLPEFPEQLDSIDADWSNDWICNSLFQNISSLQHDISASDSLSLRGFTSWPYTIPSWFHHRGTGICLSVNLPENWYVPDNFLGFAVYYCGKLIDITAHLIPLCDDGISCITQKLSLSNHSKYFHFFLVPFAGLWDTSKANGKTPNDYGHIRLCFSEELKEFGLRLLYKDDPELDASLSSSKKHSNIRGRVASLFRNFTALS